MLLSTSAPISIQVPAFSSFGSIPRREIAGSRGSYMLNFLKNSHAILHNSCSHFIFPPRAQGFPFFCFLTVFAIFWRGVSLCVLNNNHPSGCEVRACGLTATEFCPQALQREMSFTFIIASLYLDVIKTENKRK